MSASRTCTRLESESAGNRAGRRLWLISLVAVLVLAGFLRLWDLEGYPAWYADEADHLFTAAGVVEGEMRVLGVYGHTSFTPFFPYPPLFHLAAAPLVGILGERLLSVRLAGAVFSLSALAVLMWTASMLLGRWPAVIAGLLYALHPPSVIWDRWGYPQSLAMLLLSCSVAFFCLHILRKEAHGRWLAAGALSAGLATVTVFWAVPYLFVFALGVLLVDRRRIWTCALAAIPLAVLLLSMIAIHSWDSVTFDMKRLAELNVAQYGVRDAGPYRFVRNLLANYRIVLSGDLFALLGLAGLFFVPGRWPKLFLLASFAALSFQPVRTRGDHVNLFYYNAFVFKGFFLLGVAALSARGLRAALGRDTPSGRTAKTLLLALAVALLALRSAAPAFPGLLRRTPTAIHRYCVQDHSDARFVADWINKRRPQGSFIIADTAISWLLEGPSTILLPVACREGVEAWILVGDYPPERYRFDCSLANAAFFLADRKTFEWTIHQDSLFLLERMEREGWPLVLERGEYRLYANPALTDEYDPDPNVMVLRDPALYEGAAGAHMERGEYLEAARGFLKAFRLRPKDAHLAANAGVAYARMGDPQAARAYLERALLIDPDNEAARHSLTNVMRDFETRGSPPP